MKIDPNAPAYPIQETATYRQGCWDEHEKIISEPGMSIRAEIASRIMAGFASNITGFGECMLNEPSLAESCIHEGAAIAAVAWADALLTTLNEPKA